MEAPNDPPVNSAKPALRILPTPGVRIAYRTERGTSYVGDSLKWLRRVPDESVDLVLCSPPFALNTKKKYGNESESNYLEWFEPFTLEIWRVLKETGSFVVELGSAWLQGMPVRSLYQFKVLLSLVERDDRPFYFAQDFYWHNPARLPSPAQWVTIKRVRVKDAVSPIWWLSKTDSPKADNRRVLKQYSQAQLNLYENGFNAGIRPSQHRISASAFGRNNGGAIPPNMLPVENLLVVPNTASTDRYIKLCRENGLPVHPARFPVALPHFFINLLTEPGDLVLDPFAGSNSVGAVAEDLERTWLACELSADYVEGSRFRFEPTPDWTAGDDI